jgi:hypothetical protein
VIESVPSLDREKSTTNGVVIPSFSITNRESEADGEAFPVDTPVIQDEATGNESRPRSPIEASSIPDIEEDGSDSKGLLFLA